MEYAVFDWDNTVRKGYTLFSWIDYLYNNGVFPQKAKNNIDLLRDAYNNGELSHDLFAVKADMLYCNTMKGITKRKYDVLVDGYMIFDRKFMFSFTKRLFQLLSNNNIRTVIISGAPESILSRYRQDYNIDVIYAFSESFSEENVCTGEVLHNYGYRKELLVKRLYEQYAKYPLLGFGDSTSDYPLLKCSHQAYCIVSQDQANALKIPGLKYIENTMGSREVAAMIEGDLLATVSSCSI